MKHHKRLVVLCILFHRTVTVYSFAMMNLYYMNVSTLSTEIKEEEQSITE
jgi:hypothetical protein